MVPFFKLISMHRANKIYILFPFRGINSLAFSTDFHLLSFRDTLLASILQKQDEVYRRSSEDQQTAVAS